MQEWISNVRHIELEPDPNQEPRTGYLFYVDLFEGEERKLRFLPNEVEGNYYIYSKELEQQIINLFNAK
jgi:hypothetical protein